jgi:hypothetical protein
MTGERRLSPFSVDEVRVVPSRDEGVLRVALSGNVDMRDPGEVFNPFWADVDAEAVRQGIGRVEVDLRSVGFMNSSGILTLVRWVMKLIAHDGGARYRVLFRYDPGVTWQSTNVPVLARLAPEAVSISDSG